MQHLVVQFHSSLESAVLLDWLEKSCIASMAFYNLRATHTGSCFPQYCTVCSDQAFDCQEVKLPSHAPDRAWSTMCLVHDMLYNPASKVHIGVKFYQFFLDRVTPQYQPESHGSAQRHSIQVDRLCFFLREEGRQTLLVIITYYLLEVIQEICIHIFLF